jgi:hypothetical protein
MSYIRELRPYMYWLGFLSNGREAGELDWTAIGGTWGIATSRLADWERPEQHFKSSYLESVLQTIASSRQKSGALLAKYIARYVEDMWKHFCELPKLLASGAEIHYIVGNSTFYGTLVSTEQLYVEMLSEHSDFLESNAVLFGNETRISTSLSLMLLLTGNEDNNGLVSLMSKWCFSSPIPALDQQGEANQQEQPR